MPRANWRLITRSKAFYVRTYRKLTVTIIMSMILNVVLCSLIGYVYLHRQPRMFYASNGIMEPIQLDVLEMPNYTENYLLPPDPILPDQDKMIPE